MYDAWLVYIAHTTVAKPASVTSASPACSCTSPTMTPMWGLNASLLALLPKTMFAIAQRPCLTT